MYILKAYALSLSLRVTASIPTLITGKRDGDFFIDNSRLKVSYISYVLLEKNIQMSSEISESLVYETIPVTTVCI